MPTHITKSLHLLLIVALTIALTVSVAPVRHVRAESITTTSDLVVKLLSGPKHAKACQTFEVTFTVTNLGPDPASGIYAGVGLTDQFDQVALINAPESLAVKQTVTVKALIKVTAFVPGESRIGRVSPNAVSDPFPNISIDPNPDNNYVESIVRLISKQVISCP